MLTNERLAAKALEIALSEVGKKEATGHNDGVFVRMLQRWLAKGSKWMDGQPWCATFATWCIYQAADQLGMIPLLPKSGSSTSIYAFARKHGLVLDKPVPGCIGLMRGNGGSAGKTHHHTFIVVSVDLLAGLVHSVDGNWKNAVSRPVHSISGCDFVSVV